VKAQRIQRMLLVLMVNAGL